MNTATWMRSDMMSASRKSVSEHARSMPSRRARRIRRASPRTKRLSDARKCLACLRSRGDGARTHSYADAEGTRQARGRSGGKERVKARARLQSAKDTLAMNACSPHDRVDELNGGTTRDIQIRSAREELYGGTHGRLYPSLEPPAARGPPMVSVREPTCPSRAGGHEMSAGIHRHADDQACWAVDADGAEATGSWPAWFVARHRRQGPRGPRGAAGEWERKHRYCGRAHSDRAVAE